MQCNFVDDWRIVLGREHDVCSRIFRLAAICYNGNHGIKSVIERFWSSRKWIVLDFNGYGVLHRCRKCLQRSCNRIFNVKFGAIWLALKFFDRYSAILWGAFSLILLPVSTETSTSEMSYEYAIYMYIYIYIYISYIYIHINKYMFIYVHINKYIFIYLSANTLNGFH